MVAIHIRRSNERCRAVLCEVGVIKIPSVQEGCVSVIWQDDGNTLTSIISRYLISTGGLSREEDETYSARYGDGEMSGLPIPR